MSNTIIQIKRSSVTDIPSDGSLLGGEIAYSYTSNTLFIGTANGTKVISIGGSTQGKFFNDLANSLNTVISTGGTTPIGPAFDKANTSGIIASAAFDKANSANLLAFNTGIGANAYAATVGTSANTFTSATIAGANVISSAAFDKANSANSLAKSAYDTANTKFSSSGGTITGDVSIVGTLNLSGNTVFANVNTLIITDPLLYLAGNNYTSDIVDIGFVGNYVNTTGSNVHTGLYREHSNKEWYLFYGYDKEPENNHIDPNGNNFTIAVLNADLKTSNLVLGGMNTINWITNAYNKANSANYYASLIDSNTIASFTKANSASILASGAFDKANSGSDIASSAFDKANTANVNAANASFLTTGTVPSARVSGSYTGITGVGTITAGTWNADAVTVPYGGTGMISFTSNGILYGNTTGAIKVTSAGTEGQVLQASSTGVPSFGHLDGGSF
jgi:hypothetical protein